MPESGTPAAIGRFLDATRDARARFLAALVRTPTDNPPGDLAAATEAAAHLLGGLGLEVERHPVPDELARQHGMVSATNLVVRHRFGDGPTLALNAHGDVVPPGAGWTADPYGAEIRDGRLYGRGAAVSKSDFATYAYALAALIDSRAPLAGTVELHFTWDEESGGAIGPRLLLESGISRPDFAICAGFSYAIVAAHNGCLHLEVTVEGRSAHAAEPESGADALVGAHAILGALYAEREGYRTTRSAVPGIGSPSLVVGLIEGGTNTNVVPDRVRLTLDRRIVPEESPDEVEARLRAVIAAAAADHPALGVTVRRLLLARPLARSPDQEPLIAALDAAARAQTGEGLPVTGVPLYTDARHYSEAGVPVVLFGAGPRTILEANAHRADENVALADLERATAIVAAAIANLLARRPEPR